MSTFTASVEHGMTTTAFFQALMGGIWTQIQAMGWVLSSDTGQTDPNSASLPSAGAYAGYSIFKPGDALTPFYVKMEWGRGGSNQPVIRVQIGTSTNGSGTLSGQTSAQTAVFASVTGGVYSYYVSGTTSRLTIVTAGSASSSLPGVIAIGRSVDSSGADTNTAIELWITQNAGNGSPKAQAIPFSGTVPTTETVWPGIVLSRNPPTIGSANPVGICALPLESGMLNPSPLVALYSTGSPFTHNTTTTMTIYGGAHTYLVVNVTSGYNSWSAFVRYE